MSKKNLTFFEIGKIIDEYLQAVELVKGEKVVDQTELTYRKGWFHLRVPGHPASAPAIPYRPKEIEAMTAALLKRKG